MTSGDRPAVTRRSVYIVVGCDTDPDREGLVGPLPPESLTWRGVTEGIPAVKQLLHGLRDSEGREPVFTWLLRADEQVRQLCGEYAWVVGAHGDLLRDLERGGDELGWHPHFWRREPAGGAWFQEVEDVPWQVSMLREAHAALSAALPGRVRSVRMGWNYHNNETFGALEQLGVAVDFSAIPGMRTLFGRPPERRENLFDWYPTPGRPFHPSRADYRSDPQGREPAFSVLEVPSFASSSSIWGIAAGLQLARKTKSLAPLRDAILRPTYWINLTARPRLFAPLVRALRTALQRGGSAPIVFATYFHPDELLPNRSPLYELASVRTNLESLLRACAEAGTAVEFLPASQLADRWPAAQQPTDG